MAEANGVRPVAANGNNTAVAPVAEKACSTTPEVPTTTRGALFARIRALVGTPGRKGLIDGQSQSNWADYTVPGGTELTPGKANLTCEAARLLITEGSKANLEKAVKLCEDLEQPSSGAGQMITYFKNVATLLRAEALLALKGEGKQLDETTIDSLIANCNDAISWLLNQSTTGMTAEMQQYDDRGLDLYQAFNGKIILSRLMRERVGGYQELEAVYDEMIGLQLVSVTWRNPNTNADELVPALRNGNVTYLVRKDRRPSADNDLANFRIGLNYLKIMAKLEKASLLSSSQDPATILSALSLVNEAIGTTPTATTNLVVVNRANPAEKARFTQVVPVVAENSYGILAMDFDIKHQSGPFQTAYTNQLQAKFQTMPLKSFQYYQARILRAKLHATYASLTGAVDAHIPAAITENTELASATLDTGGYPLYVNSRSKIGRISIALSFDMFETLYNDKPMGKKEAISCAIAELREIINPADPRLAPSEYEYVDAMLLLNKLLLMRNINQDPNDVIANCDKVLMTVQAWNNRETVLDITARALALKAPALISTTKDSEVRKHALLPLQQAQDAVDAARKSADKFKRANSDSLKGMPAAIVTRYTKKMDDSWETEFITAKSAVPDQRKWVHRGIQEENLDRVEFYTQCLVPKGISQAERDEYQAGLAASQNTAASELIAFEVDCKDAEALFAELIRSCRVTTLPDNKTPAPAMYRQYDRYVRQWIAAMNIVLVRMSKVDLRPQDKPEDSIKDLKAMAEPVKYMEGIKIKVKNAKGEEEVVTLASILPSSAIGDQALYKDTLLKLITLRAITRQIYCIINQREAGAGAITWDQKRVRITALYNQASAIEKEISAMKRQPLIEGEILNMYEEMVNATLIYSNFEPMEAVELLGTLYYKYIFSDYAEGSKPENCHVRENLSLSFDMANAFSIYALKTQNPAEKDRIITYGFALIKGRAQKFCKPDESKGITKEMAARATRIVAMCDERISDLTYWLAPKGIGGRANKEYLSKNVGGYGSIIDPKNQPYCLLVRMKLLELQLIQQTSEFEPLKNIDGFNGYIPLDPKKTPFFTMLERIAQGRSADLDDRGPRDVQAHIIARNWQGTAASILVGAAVRQSSGGYMVARDKLKIGSISVPKNLTTSADDAANRKAIVLELIKKASEYFQLAINEYQASISTLPEQSRRKLNVRLSDSYKSLVKTMQTACGYADVGDRTTIRQGIYDALKEGFKMARAEHDLASEADLLILLAETRYWFGGAEDMFTVGEKDFDKSGAVQVELPASGTIALFKKVMENPDPKKSYRLPDGTWKAETPADWMLNYASALIVAGYDTTRGGKPAYWPKAIELLNAIINRNINPNATVKNTKEEELPKPGEITKQTSGLFDPAKKTLMYNRAVIDPATGKRKEVPVLRDSPMDLGQALILSGEMLLQKEPATVAENGKKKTWDELAMEYLCAGLDVINGSNGGTLIGNDLSAQISNIDKKMFYMDSTVMVGLSRLIECQARYLTHEWEPVGSKTGISAEKLNALFDDMDKAEEMLINFLKSKGIWLATDKREDINTIIVSRLKGVDAHLARALHKIHSYRALVGSVLAGLNIQRNYKKEDYDSNEAAFK